MLLNNKKKKQPLANLGKESLVNVVGTYFDKLDIRPGRAIYHYQGICTTIYKVKCESLFGSGQAQCLREVCSKRRTRLANSG